MEKIKQNFKKISLTIFLSVNHFIKIIISNFILKPFNALLMALAFGVMALFSALTAGLNFELFGKEYNFGSDLSDGVLGAVDSGWSAFITFVKSYEPSSPLGFPLEILTEIFALFLSLLGFIVPIFIDTVSITFATLFLFGIGNLIEFISWLYLIGASIWIYQKFIGAHDEGKKLTERKLPEESET